MRKIYCCLGLIITLPAFGENLSLTTLEYVEGVLDNYQDKFPAVNTDTLITIDSTQDNGINQMPIVDTVGTDPDDDDHVPTTGAVVTGLNGRQTAVVNISNQNIVTYSGTTGTVTATPIYNSTNNTFSNGLVTASTLNTAVTTAANSKVTCYQYATPGDTTSDCLLWQINTTPTNPLTTTAYLPANIAGTTYCRKSHDNANNGQGSCSSDVYNALNNGEWATVYSYGTVKGISVCSTISANTEGTISDSQSGLQTTYDNWVNAGRPTTISGTYCYCKFLDPITTAAHWVFSNQTSKCANRCSVACASRAVDNAAFRGSLFSGTTIQ